MNTSHPCNQCVHLYYDATGKNSRRCFTQCMHPLEFLSPVGNNCIGLQLYREKRHGKNQKGQEPSDVRTIVYGYIFYDDDDRSWKFWGLDLKACHGPFITKAEAQRAADRYVDHVTHTQRQEEESQTTP